MGIRDDLLRAVRKGEVALIVLANFLKIFQTVRYKKNSSDNKALFHFFFKIFLRRPTSYLSNRSDFVQIDVQMSNQASVHFVVPQRTRRVIAILLKRKHMTSQLPFGIVTKVKLVLCDDRFYFILLCFLGLFAIRESDFLV